MKALAASRLPRRALIVLALALVISLFALFAVQSVAAQTGTGARVEAEVLSVRSGPGGGFDLIGTVARGDIVILLGRTADSSWARVRLASGVEGWVTTYYLTPLAGPLNTLPVVGTASLQALVTTEVLNVRSGASFLAAPIGVVYNGEYVNLLGRDVTNQWLYIRSGSGLIGWVASGSVAVNVPFASLPVLDGGTATTSTTGPTPTVPSTTVGATATSTQFLRVGSGPRNESDTVTFIDGGVEVKLLARNEAGDWVYIRFNNSALGWAEAPFFTSSVSIASLPILLEGQTPTGEGLSAGVIGAAEALAGAAPTTGTGGATVQSAITTFGPTAFVTAPVVNVRAGAGPGYAALAQAVMDQVVVMVGRDSQSSWIQIALPGTSTVGWVSALYLQPNASVLALPVTDQFQAAGQVTAAALNVRSGPGVWFAPVAVVYQGQYISLIGRLPDSSWLKVMVNGQAGWVGSSAVITSFPLNNLPVFQVY